MKRLNISLAFEGWRGLGAFIENGQLKSLCTSFQRLFLAKCKNHSQHRLKICSKRNWRKKLQSWNRRLRMLVPIQVWMATTRAAILVNKVHSNWLLLYLYPSTSPWLISHKVALFSFGIYSSPLLNFQSKLWVLKQWLAGLPSPAVNCKQMLS